MKIELMEPEQRSEAWFNQRLGRITGSIVKDIMPSEKARKPWSDGQLTILKKLAAERLTGEREESFTSKTMQWGIDHEDEAIGAVELRINETIGESPFYPIEDYSGASPDGETATAIIETKCPLSKTHLGYLLDPDTLLKDYQWQVYMEIWASGREKGYLASYDPRFNDPAKQLVLVEVIPDPEKMEKLQARVKEANEKIEEWIK